MTARGPWDAPVPASPTGRRGRWVWVPEEQSSSAGVAVAPLSMAHRLSWNESSLPRGGVGQHHYHHVAGVRRRLQRSRSMPAASALSRHRSRSPQLAPGLSGRISPLQTPSRRPIRALSRSKGRAVGVQVARRRIQRMMNVPQFGYEEAPLHIPAAAVAEKRIVLPVAAPCATGLAKQPVEASKCGKADNNGKPASSPTSCRFGAGGGSCQQPAGESGSWSTFEWTSSSKPGKSRMNSAVVACPSARSCVSDSARRPVEFGTFQYTGRKQNGGGSAACLAEEAANGGPPPSATPSKQSGVGPVPPPVSMQQQQQPPQQQQVRAQSEQPAKRVKSEPFEEQEGKQQQQQQQQQQMQAGLTGPGSANSLRSAPGQVECTFGSCRISSDAPAPPSNVNGHSVMLGLPSGAARPPTSGSTLVVIPDPPDLQGFGDSSATLFNEALQPGALVEADARIGNSGSWGQPPGGPATPARSSNRVVGDIGAFPTPLASVLPSPVASEAYVRDKLSGQFTSLGSSGCLQGSGVLQGSEHFDQKAPAPFAPFAKFAPFGGQYALEPPYVMPPTAGRVPGTAQSCRVPGTAQSANYLTQGIPSNPDLSYLTRTPLGSKTHLAPPPRIGPQAPYPLPPAPSEDAAMPRGGPMEDTAPLPPLGSANDLDNTRLSGNSAVLSNNSNQLLKIPGSMREFGYDPFGVPDD
eukprot:CAMPEP_0172940016 /NCGR_PEP_ID=MMETSP1075-20121228/223818_1 /TAXON_ID=2916 /ORGANISM="Ceratium fusus, Strain PA161109" /LENGTH=692 /DNA_ID=CAMNT_0013801407 /DNA_START=342 /DNA_END=2420 /DNA_ORIENTATION=+